MICRMLHLPGAGHKILFLAEDTGEDHGQQFGPAAKTFEEVRDVTHGLSFAQKGNHRWTR